MRLRWKAVLSLGITAFSWASLQENTPHPEVEVVRLEVKAEPDLLISRLNPPVVTLLSPFGERPLLLR